jgi:exopolysaccharide biosynthesis polyprenyl glycosylphosphotransferase
MSKKLQFWILITIDFCCFTTAWLLFYWIRFESGWLNHGGIKPTDLFAPTLIISLFWILLFAFSGLYRERFAAGRFDELVSLIKVTLVGILLLFFLIFIDQKDAISGRKPILYYWLSVLSMVSMGRLTVRTLQKHLVLKGYGTHNCLLVGWSDHVADLYEDIQKYPAAGFKVVGRLQLPDPRRETAILTVAESGVTQALKDLPALIQTHKVQDVLIALGSDDHEPLDEILRLCDGSSVSLKLVPDFYSVIGGMAKTEHIYGLPLIEVFPEPMAAWEKATKRILDIVLALGTLLVLLPFLIVIALIIKLNSKGNIIYKQVRVGENGRNFTMLKFRTMRQDAEKETGPVWATQNDNRYTSIGKWLRKMRIDEIPQLWNVLKGDMSLVGPRPERPYFVAQLSQEIPLYKRRLRVKPGITGWAQVKWKYDQDLDDVRQKVKYDLFYIENMSLQQDINILFQTVRTAILGKGQ